MESGWLAYKQQLQQPRNLCDTDKAMNIWGTSHRQGLTEIRPFILLVYNLTTTFTVIVHI